MILVTCKDGPLAGVTFQVESCPGLVRCTKSSKGKPDILNMPDDEPRVDEQVHWYQWDRNPPGHICYRGRGCVQTITVVHAPAVRDLRDGRRERQLALELADVDQVEAAAERGRP